MQHNSKTFIVRHYILNIIERGALKTGDQVEPARQLAQRLGISFLKTQQAIQSLVQDGILETRGRKGVFVQKNWQERTLGENVSMFRQPEAFPWMPGLTRILAEKVPGIRFTYHFRECMIELRTTLHLFEHADEYLDLRPILESCYPGENDFFSEAIRPFREGERILGIPFAFSPRVIYYNPHLFKRHGCPLPQADWSWEDFMECLRRLRRELPPEKILNWQAMAYYWLNFVYRAGGRLFVHHQGGGQPELQLDSPRTKRGLAAFLELGEVLDFRTQTSIVRDAFLSGEAAMYFEGRQFLNHLMTAGYEEWEAVPMPHFAGGEDVTSQSSDVLCIRRGCTDLKLAGQFLKAMLSHEVQEYMASQRYAIPIRKSAAFRSFDLTDGRDSLFVFEMKKMRSEQCMRDPTLYHLLFRGVDSILREREDPDSELDELAGAIRAYLRITQRIENHQDLSREQVIDE